MATRIEIQAYVRGQQQVKELGNVFDRMRGQIDKISQQVRQKFFGEPRVYENYVRTQKDLGIKLGAIDGFLKKNNEKYKEQTKLLRQLNKELEGVAPKQKQQILERAVDLDLLRKYEGFLKRKTQLEEKISRARTYPEKVQQEIEEKRAQRQAVFDTAGRLGMTVAIPAMYYMARRTIGEWTAQQKILQSLAPRLEDTNVSFEIMGERIEALRRHTVDVSAQFGYTGKQGLQLVDAFSRLSDVLPNERAIMGLARGYGIPVERMGQQFAMMARMGGTKFDRATQQEMANLFAGAMEKGGMTRRSDEFMQSVTTLMQSYFTKIPEVKPDTITAILAEVNRAGIPALRGLGATQVVQGFEKMMGDQSEAMVAIQTEIVGRGFGDVAKRRGIDIETGVGRYRLAQILKSEGLATNDGFRLAKETLKFITENQGEEIARVMASSILGMPQPMIERMYDTGLMKRLLAGDVSDKEAIRQMQQMGGVAGMTRQRYGMTQDITFLQQQLSGMTNKLYPLVGLGAKILGAGLWGVNSLSETRTQAMAMGTGMGLAQGMFGAGQIGMKVGITGRMAVGANLMRTMMRTGANVGIRQAVRYNTVGQIVAGGLDVAKAYTDPERTGGERTATTLSAMAPLVGAGIGTLIAPGIGTVIGGLIGTGVGIIGSAFEERSRGARIARGETVAYKKQIVDYQKTMGAKYRKEKWGSEAFGGLREPGWWEAVNMFFGGEEWGVSPFTRSAQALEEFGGETTKRYLREQPISTLEAGFSSMEKRKRFGRLAGGEDEGYGGLASAGGVNIGTINVYVNGAQASYDGGQAVAQGLKDGLKEERRKAENKESIELSGMSSSIQARGAFYGLQGSV